MYNLSDITSIHLEVTSECQARCPMCPRRIQGGPLNPFIEITEITLEQFQSWIPIEVLQRLTSIILCGNLGDPIIAKDTMKILEYTRSINSTVHIQLHTNGSARSTEWWKKLASLGVGVTFGIDGLDDTHSLHRVNTHFNKIIENAKAFIDAGGYAVWDMLVFKHNEHQTGACQHIADQMGFKQFKTKHTSRFKNDSLHVINDQGKTVHVLYATNDSQVLTTKVAQSIPDITAKINCKAQRDKQIYISANGHVSPCCWLDMSWRPPMDECRIDYMDVCGEFYNLNTMSLENIFDSGYFDRIEKLWGTCGIKECSRQCGAFDKSGAQFK